MQVAPFCLPVVSLLFSVSKLKVTIMDHIYSLPSSAEILVTTPSFGGNSLIVLNATVSTAMNTVRFRTYASTGTLLYVADSRATPQVRLQRLLSPQAWSLDHVMDF